MTSRRGLALLALIPPFIALAIVWGPGIWIWVHSTWVWERHPIRGGAVDSDGQHVLVHARILRRGGRTSVRFLESWYESTGHRCLHRIVEHDGTEITTSWNPDGSLACQIRWSSTSRTMETATAEPWLSSAAEQESAPSAPWIAQGRTAAEWWDEVKPVP